MRLGESRTYYAEMSALDHATLRRVWIAEGERRGYELVDDDGGAT